MQRIDALREEEKDRDPIKAGAAGRKRKELEAKRDHLLTEHGEVFHKLDQ